MADKPGFNVASGFNGGVTVGINADSWDEFVTLCRQVWGEEGDAVAYGLYQNLRNQAAMPTETQAVGMLQAQLGAVPPPDAQVGMYQQPPAQPAYQQQPPAYQQPQYQQGYAQNDPNGPPPGQAHDPSDPTKTKWVKAGVSSKTGRPYPGFWAKP